MEGGKVDFLNKVILDSTVTNSQKVKCVYDKLKNLSNTIFDDIINNHFDSAKNANIRFEIGNTPGGEDAITLPYIGNPNDIFSTSNYKIIINSNIVNNLSTIEIALIFIHESIHAELFERCFRLGLISAITFDNGLPKVYFSSNPNIPYSISNIIFSALAIQYYNNGQNSQWNHDLFTIGNHRERMAQNLIDIHQQLNDPNNDFLTNVNNDPNAVGTPYTIQQLMNYISWIGLEGTQDYINTIQNNVLELQKKQYVESATRTKYTHNCN